MKNIVPTFALVAALSACATQTHVPKAQAASPGQSESRPYSFGPGDGLTMGTAVVVNAKSEAVGVPAERVWIGEHYPGARKTSQALLKEKGRMYDAIDITTSDGKVMTLYFDITPYFGKF